VGAVRNRYADWVDRYETDPVHRSPRRSPSRHRRRGWAELAPLAPPALHYPATAPERSALAAAIFTLIDDGAARAAFRRDPARYAARFDLAEDERRALVPLDREALRLRFAINPMLLYQLEQRLSNGGCAADTGHHLDR
jgi:hypothetical protein